jgi:hypothetical protein
MGCRTFFVIWRFIVGATEKRATDSHLLARTIASRLSRCLAWLVGFTRI